MIAILISSPFKNDLFRANVTSSFHLTSALTYFILSLLFNPHSEQKLWLNTNEKF